jgi:hypothetical protein
MNVGYVVGLFIQLSSFHEATSFSYYYMLLAVPKHMSTFSEPLWLFIMIHSPAGGHAVA